MKNLLLSLFFISALLLWPATAPAAAQTIYVDDDANIGGNGRTWPTAYNYLQHALAVAVMDDEIWVAEGTYKPDEDTANPAGTDDRTAAFQLKNDLAIYGGFPSGGGQMARALPECLRNHPQRRPCRFDGFRRHQPGFCSAIHNGIASKKKTLDSSR